MFYVGSFGEESSEKHGFREVGLALVRAASDHAAVLQEQGREGLVRDHQDHTALQGRGECSCGSVINPPSMHAEFAYIILNMHIFNVIVDILAL